MRLLITITLLLVLSFSSGWLMATAFEEPLSYILSIVLGFIYGWFVLNPMLKWSFKK